MPDTDWQEDLYTHPPNWNRPVWNLSDDAANNGYQNEDLIVWMRTAALPTFRKLYRRVDHSVPPFAEGLPKGSYVVDVEYRKLSSGRFPPFPVLPSHLCECVSLSSAVGT